MKIRHVVSPRASVYGAKLLANGIERAIIEQTILWKGLDDTSKNKVIQNLAPREVKTTRNGKFIPIVNVGDTIQKEDIIGEIEYEYKNTNYGSTSTRKDEIKSRYNGKIVSISTTKEITEKEVIAKIDSYNIIQNDDDE